MWVETEATEKRVGSRMPLDADPANPRKALKVDNGNLIFTGQRTGDGSWIVRYVPASAGQYRSHFASCPNASKHRRPR